MTATQYTIPKLRYNYSALEPYIDTQTVSIHYNKHHQGYVNKLNEALQKHPPQHDTLEQICQNIHTYTNHIRNQAGGHYNHTHYWSILSPQPQQEPQGPLKKALTTAYGSIQTFVERFNNCANTHFGSGWAWLILQREGRLSITSTNHQDNPLMPTSPQQGIPILGIDLWEHAYYLKYQNKRADYLHAIWHIVDWLAVEQHYEKAAINLQNG